MIKPRLSAAATSSAMTPLAHIATPAGAIRVAFAQPGVLQRSYQGPLGTLTGAERLHIRIADLLAHGWDLAQATGQPPSSSC